MSRRQKQKHYRMGAWAERFAVLWLVLAGYRICARNWRCPLGEIDIIARKGRVLVFIEVKFRANTHALDYAVTPRQWYRIARAANAYVARHRRMQDYVWRFDEMRVSFNGWPRLTHIIDAWRPAR